MRSAGPLDPDPFASAYARGSNEQNVAAVYYRRFPHAPWAPLALDIAASAVSLVAYIPPGSLPWIFRVFSDDGVDDQPEWLSDAIRYGRYRLAAGLRLETALHHRIRYWSPRVAVFARANPTTFRGLGLPKFSAPIEYASPTVLVPPPARYSDELTVAGVHMRSKNGFFDTKLGLAAARMRGYTSERIPQIGLSVQIWIAQDGCKCIAAAHNFFPKYDLYIDGVRFRWQSQPDFREFDAYKLPVDWRAFLAFRLYDALRPFPLIQRYPGACTVGWYEGIRDDGTVDWCSAEPEPLHVWYRPPESVDQIREWWKNLDKFVRRFRDVDREQARDGEPERPWVASDEQLDTLWRGIIEGAMAAGRRRSPSVSP